MRLPCHFDRLPRRPRLDQDAIRGLEEEALARFEHVVVDITQAGDPHAAAEHREFAGKALGSDGGVELHGSGAGLRKDLRSHHESPGRPKSVFLVTAPV